MSVNETAGRLSNFRYNISTGSYDNVLAAQ
jgi:hypothetical protein